MTQPKCSLKWPSERICVVVVTVVSRTNTQQLGQIGEREGEGGECGQLNPPCDFSEREGNKRMGRKRSSGGRVKRVVSKV